VTFSKRTIRCEDNTELGSVKTMITLGVACEDSDSKFWFYDNLLIECTEAKYDFVVLVDQYGIDGSRVSCGTSAVLPTRDVPRNISAVSISTNDLWLEGSVGKICYEKKVTSSAPVSAIPTTPSPTIRVANPTFAPATQAPIQTLPVPLSTLPSPVPGIPQTPSPTIKDTNPTLAPAKQAPIQSLTVTLPISPPVLVPTKTESSGVSIGAIMGGFAGGIALMAVAIGFFVLRNRQAAGGSSNVKDDNREPSATDSGTVLGNSHGPMANSSTSSMPTTSFIQARSSNYHVSYKDQSRSVVDPAYVPREHIPVAEAVNAKAVRAEPPGCRLEDGEEEKEEHGPTRSRVTL
jgi:hypothetical protein